MWNDIAIVFSLFICKPFAWNQVSYSFVILVIFVLEYRHLQPLLEYLCLRQAELCLPIVYILKDGLSIITVKFGQELDFEAHHVLISFKTEIQGVSKPMSQTFPGYSPPQNKQKNSYQHGSKNEQVLRYPVLCRNLRTGIKTAELPFHIRYDSHVKAVASYNKQVFIVHAWVVPRWLFVDRGAR